MISNNARQKVGYAETKINILHKRFSDIYKEDNGLKEERTEIISAGVSVPVLFILRISGR
jgi:hypothetical protein